MKPRHTTIHTAVGELTLAAEGQALTGIYFEGHRHMPRAEALGTRVEFEEDEFFQAVAVQLEEYLTGERTSFDLDVVTHGDSFQERVWAALGEIPYGGTITYGEIAESLGDKSMARIVGGAVGRNPVSIVVPCHRVVGSDGKLTGYAGGLERKQHLLELEEPVAAEAGRLF